MTAQNAFPRRALAVAVAATMLAFAGCAGQNLHREGMDLFATGRYDEGLAKLAQASEAAPGNPVYRMAYLNARERLVRRLLADAAREQAAGQLDAADHLYQRAAQLDPNSAGVRAGLDSLAQAGRHALAVAEARQLAEQGLGDAALEKVALVLAENPGHAEARLLRQKLDEQAGRAEIMPPRLAEAFRTPVRLEFRDAGLKQVLEVLSRYGGLNFVVDKEVPDTLMVTVFLRDVTLADAIDLILTTHQLRRRVLNDNTLLIYPDTVAKQGEHQELVVKNVFLSNSSAKQVETMLKTVLKMRNVYSDDRLNLLIMRDSPEMIRLASRIVTTQDVSEPEVMLEVAIVEVKRSSLRNLGIQWPNQLSLAPLTAGKALTLQELTDLDAGGIGAAISPLTINLVDNGDVTNLLANPRIRTRNREKAMIKIGDRVPVITTTATSTGFLSENVQYIDVGLMLEVEPTIYPGDEVAIKLNLEVSSVVKEVVSLAGSISYQIGGRNASTVLRLKNGETQILGGLINDEDRRTASRFPGLGRLPLIGRLFSSESDNNAKTELILSITPRVVRSLAPPAGVPGEFWSGTENDPRLRDHRPAIVVPPPPAPPAPVPATVPATTAPPAATEPATTEPPGAATPPAVAAEAARLSWRGPERVKQGDTFNLVLAVSSSQEIRAFPLAIKFDKSVFEVVDAVPGPFMAQGDMNLEVSKRIENGFGLISLAQVRRAPAPGTAPPAPTSGGGDLAILTLRALKPATMSQVRVLPSDPLGPGEQPIGVTEPAVTSIDVLP